MAPKAVIFGCEGLRLGPDEKRFFADANPWGFILFGRNLETPEQIRALCTDLRDCVGRNALILIDQEGGRVARLRGPHWHDWLPPLDFMARFRPRDAKHAMTLRYGVIAAELTALGIDTNCAPMADVPQPGVHAIIRNRCYGTDVKTVVAASRGVAEALLAGGVLPVLKHIPGHGRPGADSHHDLPHVDAPLATLQAVDFATFKGLSDLPMAMTAHVVYSAIDPYACATLSAKVITMIRDDIGFDGVLMTDDLSMSALSGSLSDRATGAQSAGCDVILHCNGSMDEMLDVAAATSVLSSKAAARADAALALRIAPKKFDITAALAELDAMSMVASHE